MISNARQTAYANKTFIGECGHLTDNVIKVYGKISGYFLMVDFEKAFDSLNHKFLIVVLKKYGFDEDFIEWIKILLTNQEFCVIYGGQTTTYFRLERGVRQGDPMLAYIFVLALELFFILIKSNKNIREINTLTANYEYSRNNTDNFLLPIQMQLSLKLKIFS